MILHKNNIKYDDWFETKHSGGIRDNNELGRTQIGPTRNPTRM